MLKRIATYIDNKEFRLILLKNRVNIVNYIEIIFMDDKRVSIKYSEGILVIKGNNLVLSKLLDDEVLVEGNIVSINLGDQ